MSSSVAGQRIESVGRHGKFILIRLQEGLLTIHLGMTGQLLFNASRTAWTRAVFQLDDCELLYDDPRMFGSIEYSEEEQRTIQLGPDALTLDIASTIDLVRARKASIKAVLLNQRIFAGVGNIYADEALFRAGIRPSRRADRIARERLGTLLAAVREVLAEAVDYRGSSVSDYVDTEGRKGGFQNRHRVYAREGKQCLVCGTVIRKSVVAQRGTHYCPVCQR